MFVLDQAVSHRYGECAKMQLDVRFSIVGGLRSTCVGKHEERGRQVDGSGSSTQAVSSVVEVWWVCTGSWLSASWRLEGKGAQVNLCSGDAVSLVANHVWSPYIRTEVVRAAGGEILGGGEGGRGGELKPICVEQAVVLFTESPAPSCFDWTPEGCLILEKAEKTALATYKTAWPSSTF